MSPTIKDIAKLRGYNLEIKNVNYSGEQMAISAIDALFAMLQGEGSRHTVFEATLLKRGSCIAPGTIAKKERV